MISKRISIEYSKKMNFDFYQICITDKILEDTDTLDRDGSPVQAYTLHFLKPIYPNNELSEQENIKRMKEDNERQCREIYEKVYGVKLTYLSEEK